MLRWAPVVVEDGFSEQVGPDRDKASAYEIVEISSDAFILFPSRPVYGPDKLSISVLPSV